MITIDENLSADSSHVYHTVCGDLAGKGHIFYIATFLGHDVPSHSYCNDCNQTFNIEKAKFIIEGVYK